LLLDGRPLPERIKPEPPPPQGEPAPAQVLKPQVGPGMPGRERPQPA
jgi:hypothetical protein